MDDLTGKISLFLKIRKVMVYSSLLLGLFLIIFLVPGFICPLVLVF